MGRFDIWVGFAKLEKKEQTKFFRSYRKVRSILQWVALLKWVISLTFLEPCEIKEPSVVRRWEDAKTGIREKRNSRKGDVKAERGNTKKLQVFALKKIKWKGTMNLMWWDRGMGQHLEYCTTPFYLSC